MLRRKVDDFEWDEHNADSLLPIEHTPAEAEQPEGLRVSLLPFQRESLHWMSLNEKDDTLKGGILAGM
jgi:hypothetical protein